MRFLVDNQLPQSLAAFLRARGFEVSHVADVGLDAAYDTEIIDYATPRRLIIITKDEDFGVRALMGKCSVPILWIRLGNCRNADLLAAFESTVNDLFEKLEAGEMLIELHDG